MANLVPNPGTSFGGEEKLVVAVAARLRDRGEHLSFAESCTGGLVSVYFASVAGVSDVFTGAVVAYSNDVKKNLLGVSEGLLRTVGAVSETVAKTMAEGVRQRMKTEWSIAVTGIAGPGGGSVEKPVGTVCFAVCGPGIEVVDRQLFSGDRNAIQKSVGDARAEDACTGIRLGSDLT